MRCQKQLDIKLSPFVKTNKQLVKHKDHISTQQKNRYSLVFRTKQQYSSALRSQETEQQQQLSASEREDDVLPDNLIEAIEQSVKATNQCFKKNIYKCQVEIQMREFWSADSGPIFNDDGDAMRFWKITKKYIDGVISQAKFTKIRVVYPDMGVAAMLQNQYEEVNFSMSSLNDRKVIEQSDELVIFAAPDPTNLGKLTKICDNAHPEQFLVLFNPRLFSGDAGIGFAVRQSRKVFLSQFVHSYYIRQVSETLYLFRCFPNQWKFFMPDQDIVGRYKLLKEFESRPNSDDIDETISSLYGDQGPANANSGVVQFYLSSTFRSISSFMRQIMK